VNLRREARWLRPIGLIMVIALACGAYILNKQRLSNPLRDRYTLQFEFNAVDAVGPDFGSPVTVAGVTVGQIDGRRLKDGRGVIRATMDPGKLPRVYADARAALIPNTPLKDMQIRLQPGSREAGKLPDGGTIPARSTTSPINADELLRALDADTRTWLQSMLNDMGIGLRGRAGDLRATLKNLGPTAAQMRRVTRLLAERRKQIPRLVHNLRLITEATAKGDGDIRQVVDAGNATLETLAQNDEPLKDTLTELPATLAAARATLERTPRFMDATSRALRELEPSIEQARTTLRRSPDALEGLVPLPVADLKTFIDAIAPLAPTVRASTRDLTAALPALRKAFGVLGRTTNRLAADPGDGRSYLFWIAWFAHNTNSVVSTQDDHGSVARGMALFSCGSTEGRLDRLGDLIEQVVAGSTRACER
jgi:phospholipid/cholesterol/gamma-HCH transport system substrate-binding protein